MQDVALAEQATVPREELASAPEREELAEHLERCARASREVARRARANVSAGSQSRFHGSRPSRSESSPSAQGRPGTAHEAGPMA